MRHLLQDNSGGHLERNAEEAGNLSIQRARYLLTLARKECHVEDSFSSRAPNEFGLSHDAAIVAAKTARLRYVNDRRQGIVRERNGKGFVYRDYAGAIIADPDELARINAIAVPPAWAKVWICPDPNGHIQATGRDARGRKQYRYHARWRKPSGTTSKFEHMLMFGARCRRSASRVDLDLVRGWLAARKGTGCRRCD